MSSDGVASRVLKKLEVQDVLCPICREIYIEPVSLPCRHAVCLRCLQKTVENTNLTCPICRKRISTFIRLAKNLKKIIDQPLWDEVKTQFPEAIERKRNGLDDGISEKFFRNQPPPGGLAKNGSIKHDFDQLINKLKIQEEQAKFSEQIASETLAKKIIEEDLAVQNRDRDLDQEIANSTAAYLKTAHLLEKGQSDNFSAAPTPSTSSLCSDDNNENGRDSISGECSHFTPICIMPRTPPKILPNGEKKVVKIFKPKYLGHVEPAKGKFAHIQTVLNKTSFKISSNNFFRTKSKIFQQGNINAMVPSDVTGISDQQNFSKIIPMDYIKSQEEIQNKFQQEQEDLSLAKKLHAKWNKEKASAKRLHGYKLRSMINK